MATHFIYILECSNASYYTGYTNNLERRYLEHVAGSAKCKYTRSFPPKRLAAYWQLTGPKRLCLRLEHQIKALSKTQKRSLIDRPNEITTLLTLPPDLAITATHPPNKT